MNTQQKSIIGELLTGIDLAYESKNLRELALCLRTATTYTEGLVALETEGARPVATLAPAGPPAAAFQEALFDHFAAPPAEVILPDETNLHGLVEIPDIKTACRYAGQHVLLGHLAGQPAGEICWAPSSGVLTIRGNGLSTGEAGRSIEDRVVLRVLPQAAKPAEECVVLQSYGGPNRKMQVIKALRNAVLDLSCENCSGRNPSLLGLKAAKTLVESAPIVLASAGPHTEELVRSLQAAGATVDVLPRVNGNHHLDHASEVYAHFAELARESGGASRFTGDAYISDAGGEA